MSDVGGKLEILVEPDTRAFPGKLASGLRATSSVASSIGKGIAVALAAGTLAAGAGFTAIIAKGNEYTGALNDVQAVTKATDAQMRQVATTAKALGADMTLPATSAADAAAAMDELAKGGLNVDQAMRAAKGTLQLAAAAQTDAASAAEIESNTLNAFALSADNAGRVADVLANTSNAAAGSIADIGNSLKYVAPVSASLKVSLEDTAAAIGLLANQGIQGEQAGTSLRGILASLSAPSRQAKEALKALGVQAFDNQGKFIGLRKFTDELAQAKHRMTDAEFAAAAATAFGNEGLTAANALAASGASAFDDMATAVSRTGGAADVAAAKTKGLGGAIEGFKSQVETAGISIYEVIAPKLEGVVRSGADMVARFTPTVVTGLNRAIAGAELFGPRLAKAIESKAQSLAATAGTIISPLRDGLKDSLNNAFNLAETAVSGFNGVVREGVDVVHPLVVGIGDLAESLDKAGGPVGAVREGLQFTYSAVKGVITVAGPLIGLVGGLVTGFSDLPGPIQTAAIALLALKVGPTVLSGLKSALSGAGREADSAAGKTGLFGRTVSTVLAPARLVVTGVGGVVSTLRQFGDEVAVQRGVAAGAGQEIGRLGGAAAAFNTSAIPAVATLRNFRDQTRAVRDGAAAAGQPIGLMSGAITTLVERSPALSRMREAFENASQGAERFGRVAGVAAAAGSGLRSAGAGLVGLLGGPWGIALAGATLGLGLLAERNEEAARREQEHRSAVTDLAHALRDAGRNAEQVARQKLAETLTADFKDAADAAAHFGVSLSDIVDTAISGKPATEQFAEQMRHLQDIVDKDPLSDEGQAALRLIGAIGELGKRYADTTKQNQAFADATKTGGGTVAAATASTSKFADAMKVLSDNTSSADEKTRALKDALDVLAGGQIDVESAQARLNETLDNMRGLFDETTVKSKGFTDSLLTGTGQFNIATENGRKFRDSLKEIRDAASEAASRTFDVTGSVDQAKGVVQNARDAFIKAAGDWGIGATKAGELADAMGLIPDEVITLIKTPGMDLTQTQLQVLRDKIKEVPDTKTVIVNALTADAITKLESLGFTVTHLQNGTFEVTANTATANDELLGIVRRWNGFTITLNAQVRGGVGGNLRAQLGAAKGAIVQGYAAGGIRQLTPMSGSVAQRVDPNTWRVIGDRLKGREYFLPDDDEPRSLAIGAEWARNRGLALIKMFATGGIATSTPSTASRAVLTSPGATVNNYVTVRDNEDAFVAARALGATTAFQMRFGG